MKNFKTIIMSTITFGLVISFMSCEKETAEKNSAETALKTTLTTRPISDQNRVGEDEEEDVIMGNFEDSNGIGIPNVNIDLLANSDSTVTDSDMTSATGEFQLSGPSGEYLFKIDLSTGSIYSESFTLNQNMQILIQL